jgi:uncharacterized protein
MGIQKGKSIQVNNLQQKQDALIRILQKFDSLMVAFSGGVDSTFLLSVAYEVLGDKVVAITSSSSVHPQKETKDALEIAEKLCVRQVVVDTDEMKISEFRANYQNRCYVCKQHLFQIFKQKAAELGIHAICHGANLDDLDDIRPGFAAAQEQGIHAPLIDAELTKADIRQLSRNRNLPTWNKPAMACLATRIPFGMPIYEDMLRMIESSEQLLQTAGFSGCRVRHHGNIARIEICKEDFSKITHSDILSRIVPEFKKLGFVYIALDLEGYIQGSMNQQGGS